jgi:hypothetical protein
MNIFVLDNDYKKCAKSHVDKHVVKMILEHAQMMCTVHHLTDIEKHDIPYKATHANHPCTKWLRDSIENYEWLYNMTSALNDEYRYRYDKNVNHKSFDVIKSLPFPNLPDVKMTRFARAMPDECKIDNDVVASYRNYYNISKQNILKWTKRDIPKWINKESLKNE